jgi:uncharacterized protein (TIGR03437 family)
VESGTTKWNLYYVSPGQINVLAGQLPASGTVPVTVVTNCGTANEVTSAAMNVPVAAVAPEFLYFLENATGDNPVASVDDTTKVYVGSPGLITGATFAPVHAADAVTAYGVGWGGTTSSDPIGTLATGAAKLTSSYSLTLGGMPVSVSLAGLRRPLSGEFYGSLGTRRRKSGARVDRRRRPHNLERLHHGDQVSASFTSCAALLRGARYDLRSEDVSKTCA